MTTYRILRVFLGGPSHKVTHKNLSITEAQMHCQHPEHNSRTATGLKATALTQRCGPWFDTYQAEAYIQDTHTETHRKEDNTMAP